MAVIPSNVGNSLFEGLLGVKRTSVAPTKVAGSIGTAVIGGFILEKEKNKDLYGTKKYETFSNILSNTTIIAAGVSIYLNFIGKSKWKIIPASDSAADEAYAEFMEEVLYDMETPWSRVLRRLCMYKFYGFSIHEWTAKKRKDGKIGLLDIENRPQHTIEQWDIDRYGNIHGVVQTSPLTQENIYLPKSKLIYIVEDALTDDPRGMGLLRQIVETNKKLQDYQRLEQIGFETDMRGIPILYAPLQELEQLKQSGGISNDYAVELQTKLEGLIKNHIRSVNSGLLLPSEQFESRGDNPSPVGERKFAFELVSGEHYGHSEIGDAINRLQKEMARVLGVEQLLLGESSTGSLALARDKSKNFADGINAVLLEVSQVINKDLIEPIWKLNGFPEESMPKSSPETVEQRDIEQITAAIRDMASAGVILTGEDEPIGEVFDQLGLTRPDTELQRLYAQESYLGSTQRNTSNNRQEQDPKNSENTDDTEDSKRPSSSSNSKGQTSEDADDDEEEE